MTVLANMTFLDIFIKVTNFCFKGAVCNSLKASCQHIKSRVCHVTVLADAGSECE